MFNLFWRPFVPGFRVRPDDDVPGFNVDQNSLRRRWFDGMLPDAVKQGYPDAAQTEMPYSMSVPTLVPEGMVQSTPFIGLAGFRVSPQDNVPGFNAGLRDDAPGFGLDDDVEEQETNWSLQTPPPDTEEEPVQPSPPQFPEWVYKLVNMLPQVLTASDPLEGRHAAVNLPPSLPSIEPPVAKQWASSELPLRSEGMDIVSPGAPTQNTGSQPVDQRAMSKAWPRSRHGGWPYSQPAKLPDPWNVDTRIHPVSIPPRLAPGPVERSNFIPANAPGATGPQVQQQAPLQQHQQTQPSSSLGAVASGSGGPSLGERLAQSSVDTVVPGAYYQKLARDQFGSGNYIGAGVYQGAALLDAALGAATLGLSTRLGAGIRAVAGAGGALYRRAFDSHSQLLRYLGRPPEGMHWHHIVEQSQAAKLGQRAIQSVENIVAIPIETHQRLSAFYSSKQPFSEPNTVRVWLRGQSFQAQYQFGLQQLKHILGY